MKTILPKEPIFDYNEWIGFIHKEVIKNKNIKSYGNKINKGKGKAK